MKCVRVMFVLVFLRSVAAEYDDRLLRTFDDVARDGVVSESCQQALGLYVENFKSETDTWAFRMFDATSKMPVGLLSLNFGELGQFSQCLATASQDGLIQARYCLGVIPLSITTNTTQNEIVDLQKQMLHFRQATRSLANFQYSEENNDATSVQQSGILWAICLPSDCSSEDVGEIFGKVLGSKSVTCQTKEDLDPPLTGGFYASIVILSFFASLLIGSTALDLYYRHTHEEPPHVILIAFSMYTNAEKLFRISKNSNELTCLNGIRFFSMIWVIVGHVFSIFSGVPIVNYMDVIEWTNKLRSMTLVNGTLSVDSFFFLSGLLVVYSYIKAKYNGVKFNIFHFYIHRYLRLTPALAAMILVIANLLRYMGSGPVWPSYISGLEQACHKYWWTTLLYVQNYVNKNMEHCVPQSWYLSVDMQLYIISPLILIPLWRYPKAGVTLIGAGIVTFIIVPFGIAYVNELPAMLTNFNAQASVLTYMKIYYIKTHARAAPWFIGLFVGYILAQIKFEGKYKHLKLNKFVVVSIWMACLAVCVSCIYGGHSTLRTGDYDIWANSFYIALDRPAWALCLGWIVFACASGYGGPINWFLSLPIYQVLNRFTYSVYLIHYPLIYAYGFSWKTGSYFDEFGLAYSFWGATMFSFGLSVIWVLAFESPIVVLEKIIFSGPRKKSTLEENGRNGAGAQTS